MDTRELKAEFRLHSDGDPWGTTMAFWFAVAGEMYVRGIPIPDAWRYRPSPLGAKDPDAFETEICEQAGDETLAAFGALLNRYAGFLKRAGKDY